MNKIFGIGLSRTGTTSLTHALRLVDINIIHYPTQSQIFNPDNSGCCDIPVIRFYKELDEKFPNSKFIYTIREKKEWMKSIKAHFERHKSSNKNPWELSNRLAIYGRIEFDEKVFSDVYRRHDQDVRKYFSNREQDLLIINICNGDGWNKLLPFINMDTTPSVPFPHTNKRK